MDPRLKEACRGKTAANGGLNVGDLAKMAKRKGYTGKMTRSDLLKFLCKKSTKKIIRNVRERSTAPNPLLKKACEGKTAANGGLNVGDLAKMAKRKGYTGKMTRSDLLKFLCKKEKKAKAIAGPAKSKSRPGLSDRLRKACAGKSAVNGGLNVGDLAVLAKEKGYRGKKTRGELLKFLCGDNTKTPVVDSRKSIQNRSSAWANYKPAGGNVVNAFKNPDRKAKFKRYPHLRKMYQDVMRKFKMVPSTNPIGKGTFADIYDLGDRVLRIEPNSFSLRLGQKMVKVATMIKKKPVAIFPRIYESGILYDTVNHKPGFVYYSVMEKLDIVPWGRWPLIFLNEANLIKAIKKAVKDMLATGIYHTDISLNNVVLTAQGEIKFVDIEDSCIYNPSKGNLGECDMGETLGFLAPEMARYRYSRIDLKKKLKTYTKFNHKYGIQKSIDYGPPDMYVSREEEMKKYAIYAAGVMLYVLTTGEYPDNGLDPDRMPGSTRSMVHPDPAKRHM